MYMKTKELGWRETPKGFKILALKTPMGIE